jgi:hypothetical protein
MFAAPAGNPNLFRVRGAKKSKVLLRDLQHSRRELLWLAVTARPSAHWIARQLTKAYGWQQTPRYVVRDRDCVYGDIVIQRASSNGYTGSADLATV